MHSIQSDVDRGIVLRSQIQALKEELDSIEERLRAAALIGPVSDLEDPDRDGRQFLAQGSELTVPVILTADILAGQFADGSTVHQAALAAAGDRLTEFFRPVKSHKNIHPTGKAFRAAAAHILGASAGPALVSAVTSRDKNGIPKSAIKVEWDRAE
jgi:hypothetical protein